MKKLCSGLAVLFCFAAVLNAAGWREEFSQGDPKQAGFPVGWEYEGKLPGVDRAKIFVRDGILHLESDKASGGVIKTVEGVDLKKTPIMRWRWRATLLPPGADGRIDAKDDQAIGIYVGMPGFLSNKSVAYHYETVTPKGVWGETSYLLGAVKVKFLSLRNQQDQLGEWYTEERDVAADLKDKYGEIPTKFAVSFLINSHRTKSRAAAEVDYIEFVSGVAASDQKAATP